MRYFAERLETSGVLGGARVANVTVREGLENRATYRPRGYALAGSSNKALDWLDRAVDAGFRDRKLMTTDSDLESLRGDPRFDALVKRLP